jgi:aspartate/methionine/tyrosine aminotransferase
MSAWSKFAGNAIEEEDAFAAKLARSGRSIIRLNRGDPVAYFPTPRYMMDAYVRALRSGRTGYSFHAGMPELREAISKRNRRLYKLYADADDVIVTQGVSEAIMFINSMLINGGDRAVIFRPYYPLYFSSLLVNGGKPIYADYMEDEGYGIDVDSLRKRLRNEKRVKYLILANPSNPTGSVLERKALREIADVANDHDIFIISDEIYDEVTYNGATFTSMSEVSKGIPKAIFGGASKSFDVTGFRIGYAIIPENDGFSATVREKMADYAKMRLSSCTPAQYAFAEALKNTRAHNAAARKMVAEIESRTNFAYDLLEESGNLQISSRPKGAFYLFPKVEIKGTDLKGDRNLVRRLLVEEGVQITRGSGFGAHDHIRIVSLPDKETLEMAIRKIDKFLDRHSR